MTISRRLDRLEAAQPEHAFAVRVLFKKAGEPDPVISPPLKPNERAILVNFVPASRAMKIYQRPLHLDNPPDRHS